MIEKIVMIAGTLGYYAVLFFYLVMPEEMREMVESMRPVLVVAILCGLPILPILVWILFPRWCEWEAGPGDY